MERSPVRVELEECRCPSTPHHHDWVELAADPTVPMGAAIVAAIRRVGDDPTLLVGEMARVYMTHGIVGWSFVDEDGKPIPVKPYTGGWADTIEELLPWWGGGMIVADAADTLYSERVLRPLQNRSSRRSQGGPTAGSTSPTPVTGSTRPRPSKRSSRTNTDGTRSAGQAR